MIIDTHCHYTTEPQALHVVAERARQSVRWLTGFVSRRSLPVRRPGKSAGRG